MPLTGQYEPSTFDFGREQAEPEINESPLKAWS
jgi:hypothetical protein